MNTASLTLESVWQHREEVVFPNLFGPLNRGTFTLSIDLFTDVFRQTSIDPRWLHYGVLEFAPTVSRPSWLYVTSGASNPWEQDRLRRPLTFTLDRKHVSEDQVQ